MPTGRLGAATLAANTHTTVYAVPAGKTSALSINLCNTSSAAVTARIALAASATPANGEFIEYDAVIPASGVLERGGIVLGAGQFLVVRASGLGVNATVWGYEE